MQQDDVVDGTCDGKGGRRKDSHRRAGMEPEGPCGLREEFRTHFKCGPLGNFEQESNML